MYEADLSPLVTRAATTGGFGKAPLMCQHHVAIIASRKQENGVGKQGGVVVEGKVRCRLG
jgi:hypothetical protein